MVEISDMANYELALIVENTEDCLFPGRGPSDVVNDCPLRWKIDASVWYKGRQIEREVFDGLMAGESFDENWDCLEIVQLGILTTLKSLIGTKRFSVKVTVLAVDERYTDEHLPIQVGIRRSPRI
ncbi:MAG: hypothetical protein Q9Q40_01405 [Acidobacteriota bacterium]|nr:hypothetical protein [Acidobacteriota bacterium]